MKGFKEETSPVDIEFDDKHDVNNKKNNKRPRQPSCPPPFHVAPQWYGYDPDFAVSWLE